MQSTETTFAHSRPQRPRSFWSAPRIATSGPVQRHSVFEWLCKHNRLRPEPIRFVKLNSEHAQSDGKSVNRGLPKDFRCWTWPGLAILGADQKERGRLGTRMTFAGLELATQLISHHASIFLGVIILGMNKSIQWKCPWTSSKKRKKRTRNENTAINEQAKVDGKLKLRLSGIKPAKDRVESFN